jgi:hypothetical protein
VGRYAAEDAFEGVRGVRAFGAALEGDGCFVGRTPACPRRDGPIAASGVYDARLMTGTRDEDLMYVSADWNRTERNRPRVY